MAAPPLTPTPTLSPALGELAEQLDDLIAAGRVRLAVVVPDERWGDPRSACPDPAQGGPREPLPAAAYLRRDLTVGNVTATYREPVCAVCLRSAVRWELACRLGVTVVDVDLIAGAA